MIDTQEQELTDDDLAGLIEQELSVALGSDYDDIKGNHEEAHNYYFGKLPGKPTTEGRSSARSNDVADMVEAMLAQIMPTFTGDSVATFEANGPEDEQQAQVESDLVNYQIMERADGYQLFYMAIKNALLLKNGIVKVFVDEYDRIDKKQYPPLEDIAISMLQSEHDGELWAEDNDQGTVITKLVHVKKLCIQSVDPANFVVKSDHRSLDMQGCKFCGEQIVTTEGELIEQGYDSLLVADLPNYSNDTDTGDRARNQSHDEDEHYHYERSQRPVRVWEVYITLDSDGDGYPELHKVIMGDDRRTILLDEIVDWVPYAVGTPFINPHRWLGISLFDKLKEIANQKTEFTRQWIDNVKYHNNKRLWAIKGQVEMNDAVNSRPGGVIRVKSANAVGEIPTSDIGPTCMNALGYLDKQRSERAGASLDMQSQGLQSGDETAHGVERQMAFKEQMAGMITRTLAETLVKNTYLLAHRTMKHFFGGETVQARKGGIWQKSDPETWGERENVSINVGMSQGERARQAQAMLLNLNLQKEAMQAGFGGILTGPQQLYNSVMDYCRVAGLDNPSQYWINPQSPEAQQAAQQQQQNAAMQAQAQQAQQMAVTGKVVEIEQFKAASEANKDMRDYEAKIGKILMDAEIEQMKMTGEQEEVDRRQAELDDEI